MYDFIEDRFGGVTLYRDRSDFLYLQPGDDANSFLSTVEDIWRVKNLSDDDKFEQTQHFISQYDL